MAKRPSRFWRVTWDAAVGWPHPERRVEKVRNCTDPQQAARLLATIAGMPSHLQLKSVEVSNDVEWSTFDPADLPAPEPQDNDNEGINA